MVRLGHLQAFLFDAMEASGYAKQGRLSERVKLKLARSAIRHVADRSEILEAVSRFLDAAPSQQVEAGYELSNHVDGWKMAFPEAKPEPEPARAWPKAGRAPEPKAAPKQISPEPTAPASYDWQGRRDING